MEVEFMKIISAEIQSTRIPVIRAHEMAIGTTYFQENVIVKLVTDGGLFGFGEAPHMVGHSQAGETPQTVRVLLRYKLIPAILGSNPLDQEALTVLLDHAVPGNQRAKGALILAAYDLAGKILNTPLYNLLGGKFRDSVPLSWSLPIVNIENVVEEGTRMVERGWKILKVKFGRSNPEQDIEVVKTLREAVGYSVSIRADANQAYDYKTALKVVRKLEPYNLDFLEQPLNRCDLKSMVDITRLSPIPIMADESAKSPQDLAEIARVRAADYVSIYVIGPGGLVNSKKMAAIAEAFRMRAYVGGALESIIGASAGLHLAASSPIIDLGCEMGGQFLLQDGIEKESLIMKDGALIVPTNPGLGVELDEAKLVKYREGEVEHISL
jgi:L-alanine-DL-glutamate epimerase-like enolase superfamily enzyme